MPLKTSIKVYYAYNPNYMNLLNFLGGKSYLYLELVWLVQPVWCFVTPHFFTIL